MLQFDTWLTGARQVFTMGRESALWPEYPAGSGNPSKGEMNAMLQKIQRHAFPKRWKMLLAGMVMLVPTLLAACDTGNVGVTQLDPHQILVYPNIAFNNNNPHVLPDLALDPAYAGDLYSQTVLNMIQTQLYTFDSNLNIIPDAANGLPQITNGGKTYKVSLRTGLQWSDGTKLTAHDFVFAIKHDLDPNLGTEKGPFLNSNNGAVTPGQQPQYLFLSNLVGATSYSTGASNDISGLSAVDDYTIQFQLNQPSAYFLDQLATMATMPLEESVFNQPSADGHGIIGNNYVLQYISGKAQSGPFMIQRWRDPSNSTVTDPFHSNELDFIPNPYWGGKPVTLKQVIMPLSSDLNAMYNSYLANQADFSIVPPHEYSFTFNLPDFHQVNALTIFYFGMNHLDAPFTNLKVRQAFDLALNKQILVDNAFQSSSTPTNHIIPYGIAGYNPNLLNPPNAEDGTTSISGNQDLAKTYIASVANSCATQNINDPICPYIVGTAPLTTSASTAWGNPNCPSYKVGVDAKGNSTQQEIDIYTSPSNPDRAQMVTDSVHQWAKILCLNVVPKIQGYYTEVQNAAGTTGPVSMWSVGWVADYPDAQDFTSLQFSLNGSYTNITHDPEAQDVLNRMKQADQELDPQKRIQDYQQVEQELVNEVAWIPYAQQRYIYRLRPYVKGFAIPANSFLSDQAWPNVYIAAH